MITRNNSFTTIFLRDQWGPTAFDRRHNWHAAVTSTALRNLSARIGFSGASAPPLTILTGYDDNGDLVFNDRPAGVGRNSARTVSVYNSSANLGYSFTLGKKTVTSGGGVQIMGGPAGLTVNPTGMQTTPRYRLNVSVNISCVCVLMRLITSSSCCFACTRSSYCVLRN